MDKQDKPQQETISTDPTGVFQALKQEDIDKIMSEIEDLQTQMNGVPSQPPASSPSLSPSTSVESTPNETPVVAALGNAVASGVPSPSPSAQAPSQLPAADAQTAVQEAANSVSTVSQAPSSAPLATVTQLIPSARAENSNFPKNETDLGVQGAANVLSPNVDEESILKEFLGERLPVEPPFQSTTSDPSGSLANITHRALQNASKDPNLDPAVTLIDEKTLEQEVDRMIQAEKELLDEHEEVSSDSEQTAGLLTMSIEGNMKLRLNYQNEKNLTIAVKKRMLHIVLSNGTELKLPL